MKIKEIHWYLREECNAKPRCAYCFGPTENSNCSGRRDLEMAQILVDDGTNKTTLTGGEPTLARNIAGVARTLKQGGGYVSVHTNGQLLSPAILDSWVGLVDDIALPIDTLNPAVQEQLRSKEFVKKVSSRLSVLMEEISRRGIKVGLHTVFTNANFHEIPLMYRQLKREPFKYWRIYEYNEDLARMRWLKPDKRLDDQTRMAGLLTTEALSMPGDFNRGENNGLAAEFLFMEERMRKQRDERVRFVARDDRGDYCFLRPNGDFAYYTDHSTNKREGFGNIFDDGLPEIRRRWQKIQQGPPTDEDFQTFFERESEMPLWKRQWLGNCWTEELLQIDGRSWPRIDRLIGLLQRRESQSWV